MLQAPLSSRFSASTRSPTPQSDMLRQCRGPASFTSHKICNVQGKRCHLSLNSEQPRLSVLLQAADVEASVAVPASEAAPAAAETAAPTKQKKQKQQQSEGKPKQVSQRLVTLLRGAVESLHLQWFPNCQVPLVQPPEQSWCSSAAAENSCSMTTITSSSPRKESRFRVARVFVSVFLTKHVHHLPLCSSVSLTSPVKHFHQNNLCQMST